MLIVPIVKSQSGKEVLVSHRHVEEAYESVQFIKQPDSLSGSPAGRSMPFPILTDLCV